ncbi:MAG TPA: hypothetical protein VMD05_07510, partial [Candidatus Nanoarchaeia archaeon]|nr:hypothetical protein [Candidatus Nanoarchaeia archaeon]
MGAVAFYPPLYRLLLATLIAFTKPASIEQMLALMKALTALIDVLLLLSVYLLGSRFFGKKVGAIAAGLMLLSFSAYEINFWGGYPSLLSLVFFCLLLLGLGLSSERKDFGSGLTIFAIAFSLVITDQIATFIAVIILTLFIFAVLVKSRDRLPIVWIGAILGGGLAFLLYYFPALVPNINVLISYLFFHFKVMLYQVPSVDASAFNLDFGFILLLAFAGFFLAYYKLRKEKKLIYFLLLSLSLFVPLFFSQSYLLGLLLPYQRFIYLLLMPMAIFGAVAFSYVIDLLLAFYNSVHRKKLMKMAVAFVFCIMFLILLFRVQNIGIQIKQGIDFYSTSDVSGYDAAVWLKENFPEPANVVVTAKPGSWFGMYSGKNVIAETDPVTDMNVESVLDLSNEIQNPLTIVSGLEARGIVDEKYVSTNDIWRRVSFLSEQEVFLSFIQNDITYHFDLSSLNKQIIFDDSSSSKE